VACTAGAVLGTAVPTATASPLFVRPGTLERVQDRAERSHERAVRLHVRLAREHVRLRGAGERRTAREVRDWSTPHLHEANRALRRRTARLRPQGAAAPAHLQAIVQCESGGDPRAVGGGGRYRGALQFDAQTWASVGGTGDPAAAPLTEQYARGAILYARTGGAAWPSCAG